MVGVGVGVMLSSSFPKTKVPYWKFLVPCLSIQSQILEIFLKLRPSPISLDLPKSRAWGLRLAWELHSSLVQRPGLACEAPPKSSGPPTSHDSWILAILPCRNRLLLRPKPGFRPGLQSFPTLTPTG